ncbi:MAG: hypothetical protein SP1CHLAM54_03710 [Chlamydiia bacterium]|nr:hypothetical protein [Chlamydiia bacterium]MCH9615287.1 hypothetical protein [Chlamydiia bacterium]MCH9628391.1 hypothetical protein [Chlamydiia bacterium]
MGYANPQHEISEVPGFPEFDAILQELIVERSDGWDDALNTCNFENLDELEAVREGLIDTISSLSFLDRHYFYNAGSLFKKFLNGDSEVPLEERECIATSLGNFNRTEAALNHRKKVIFHALTLTSFLISKYPNYTVSGSMVEMDDINERTVYSNLAGAFYEATQDENAFRETL